MAPTSRVLRSTVLAPRVDSEAGEQASDQPAEPKEAGRSAVEVELRRLAELSRLARQGADADREQDTGRSSQQPTERSHAAPSQGGRNRGSASPATASLSGRVAPSDLGAIPLKTEKEEDIVEPWLQELSDGLAKQLRRAEADRRRAERRATQAQQEVFRARREDARAARAAESELSEAQRELRAAESRRAPRRDAAPGRLEATLTALQEELHEQRTEAAREARKQRTKEQEDLPLLIESEEQQQATLTDELRSLEEKATRSHEALGARKAQLAEEEATVRRLRQEVEQAEAALAARFRPRPRGRQVPALREDLAQAGEQEERLQRQLEESRQQVIQLEATAAGFAEAVKASEAAAQLRQREEVRKVLLECRDLQDQIEGLRGQHRAFRAAEAAVAQATKEAEVPTPAAPVIHISRDQLEHTFRVEYDHLEARANAAASAAWVEELRRWGRELEYWRSRSQQLLGQAPSPAAAVEIRAAEEECSHAQAKAEAVESAVLRSHETRAQGWRPQKLSTARGARGATGRGTPAKPAPGKGGYSPLHLLRSVLKVEEQFSMIECETEEVASQVAQTLQAQSEMEQHTALKAELTELKEHSEQLEACEAAMQDELQGDFPGELRKEVVAGYRSWQQTTEAELRRKAEVAQSEHEEAHRTLDVWRGRREQARLRLQQHRTDAESLQAGLVHLAEKQVQRQEAALAGGRQSRELQDAYDADVKEACKLSERHTDLAQELERLQANLATERRHTAEVEDQLRSLRSQKVQVCESAQQAAIRLASLRRRTAEKESEEDMQWTYSEDAALPSSRLPEVSDEKRRTLRTELEEAFSNA